jgi:osmotically-inducible protein OsmY
VQIRNGGFGGWVTGLLALGLVIGVACGEDREARLAKATEAVTQARVQVDAAQQEVDAREGAVLKAEAELEEARERLRQARLALDDAETRIHESATDAVLFRAVQRRLLEDDALEKVAIAAHVEKGRVRLSGSVPTPKVRDRAIEVAKETPGVLSVHSEIEVGEKDRP